MTDKSDDKDTKDIREMLLMLKVFTAFIGVLIVFQVLGNLGKRSEGSVKGLSTRDQYELIERCSNSASLWYKSEYPAGNAVGYYQDHYNRSQNKCFVEVYDYSGGTCPEMLMIYDVNERRSYGEFCDGTSKRGALICNIEDEKCKTYGEWQELAKPFMND